MKDISPQLGARQSASSVKAKKGKERKLKKVARKKNTDIDVGGQNSAEVEDFEELSPLKSEYGVERKPVYQQQRWTETSDFKGHLPQIMSNPKMETSDQQLKARNSGSTLVHSNGLPAMPVYHQKE